jgi:type I restriction enzyme S subunit
MSELGRKFIVRAASSTSGLHTLSISKVESLFIPFCIEEEQNQVLIELDEKLSEIDNLDQTITTALQQSEALRQSILKKAFSGQLVTQGQDDEPASILLARIKAERAAKAPSPKAPRAAKISKVKTLKPTNNPRKKVKK